MKAEQRERKTKIVTRGKRRGGMEIIINFDELKMA